MDYAMQAVWSKGNGHTWTILGLPSDMREWGGELSPDTRLVMQHTVMDTAQSMLVGVGRALYDLYQCVDELKDGDTIVAPAQSPFRHMSYNGTRVHVPTQRWRCEGIHVMAANVACRQAIQAENERQEAKDAERKHHYE